MSRNLVKKAFALGLCLWVLSPAGRGWGEERRLVITGDVKDEYNDNIFFSSGKRTDTFITTISPGLDFVNRTERLDAGLSAVAQGLIYTESHDLNAVDQVYRGKLGYRLTPALRVSGEGGFRRDTRPDREIEDTGLFVTNRSDRWNGGAAAEYAVGEKTWVNGSYRYDKTTYDSTSLSDYATHSGSVGIVHDLGQYFPETKGRGTLGFARSEFTGVRVDNYTATVGASRGVTETWSVHADAGGRYTRTGIDTQRLEFVPPDTFVAVQAREDTNNRGWIANVALAYRGDQNQGSMTFYRDVTVAAGRQGATQRTALVLNAGRKATEHFSGSVSAGYYLNKSGAGEFSTQAIDEKTVRVRPAVRFDFTKEIFAEAAYQFTRILFGQTDTAARQNMAYFRVAVRATLFE